MTPIQLPTKDYAGYIFDLDGTIVDSMPIHFRAWRQALADFGAPPHVFEWDEFYECAGKTAVDTVTFLNQRHSMDIPAEQAADKKRVYYIDLAEASPLPVIESVHQFILNLKNQNKPISIATGSAMPGALVTLAQAGLAGVFDIIVTPEQVKHGKPAPDMFLLAAAKMNAVPSDCIVFEDGMAGILGAKEAGMDVCFIPAVHDNAPE